VALKSIPINTSMISIKKKRALAKDHNSVFVSTASDLEGSIVVIDDSILSEVV
jgi:hypothetical protein